MEQATKDRKYNYTAIYETGRRRICRYPSRSFQPNYGRRSLEHARAIVPEALQRLDRKLGQKWSTHSAEDFQLSMPLIG
jgi:hypothetical protein